MTTTLLGKKIVLGVCGTIAAYKSVELCRRLVQEGAHVIPVLTQDATRFVGEVTFSAVASEAARTSLWSDADPIPHTHLGQWADLIVVAPASADFIGKYANGLANDLLGATLLATRASVAVFPSMHTEMWEHPAVHDNIDTLRMRGVLVTDPEIGLLAGGDVGAGRFPDTSTIVQVIESAFVPHDLEGVTILVTAGGTREPIDSVRHITNKSSGKQGHAIAAEASMRGAKTILVTASSLPSAANVQRIDVATTQQLADEVFVHQETADIVIMAAAVADYQVTNSSLKKIKKSDSGLSIDLSPTTDILEELAQKKRPSQLLVGFAAEDTDVVANAQTKLRQKHLDLIVANDISEEGSGFDSETNHATLISPTGIVTDVKAPKREVARVLLDTIVDLRKS